MFTKKKFLYACIVLLLSIGLIGLLSMIILSGMIIIKGKHNSEINDQTEEFEDLKSDQVSSGEKSEKKVLKTKTITVSRDGAGEWIEQYRKERVSLNYSDQTNWAYLPLDEDKEKCQTNVDVFFVAPTSVQGSMEDYGDFVINLDDEDDKYAFCGSIGIQKGIYDDKALFYSPFYRQMALVGYYESFDEDFRESLLELAYNDVRDAFKDYLSEYNNDRKIVLAGFSQGADMIKRLMMDEEFRSVWDDKLVAAYVIGWNITDSDRYSLSCNGIKMAGDEYETGVCISFCSEAEEITSTFVVPDTISTNGINPINWRTDDTVATAMDNPGSCLDLGFDGGIRREQSHVCGAYLDKDRGTLKVIGVSPQEYYPAADNRR